MYRNANEINKTKSERFKVITIFCLIIFHQALPSIEQYLSCAVVWSEFAARNLGPKEVGALFGDIVKHASHQGGANNDNAETVRSATISKVGNS